LNSPLPHKPIVLLVFLSILSLSKPAHATSITGCAASNPPAVILQNEGDHQTYNLLGDPANIKIGDRIKLSGKKRKDVSGKRYFVVGKLEKNYGSCKVSSTAP
jgi:hypothetical protein